ncbi:MAG: hypothetical protein KC503_26805, partial [Myxococcales bacterium]|nr:hypothetical protein [Myxococcales bacterium]
MSVAERVRDKLSRYDDPEVPRIVEHLRARYDDALAAVIFYGSLLSAETRTPTSFYDFYLLTDQPWRFYRGPFQAALSYVLPPNVYYERIAAGPRFKTCAMSLAQLAVETSPAAHDLHHLGRFSKRFALVYARDAATRDAVVDAAIAAMR